jgi:predicted HicB family RNase H-like nuclease
MKMNESTIEYRGYAARVHFDPRDDLFVGRILGVRDIISFHADSVRGLHDAMKEAVDDYLADCVASNVTPERPASGRLMLRIPPQTHAAALLAAQLAGKSLNQWAGDVIGAAANAV